MGFIKDIYNAEQTSPEATDKYHLTTAYGYWREGRADNPATFYMFGRKEATGAHYSIAGALEGVIDIVERWHEFGFTKDDEKHLRAQKNPSGTQKYPDDFIDYLMTMKFDLKIDAAPEGSVFFPQEPVLRVHGPIAQAKMLESVALGLMNGHSAYITQGARQTDVLQELLDNGSPTGTASVQGLRRGPSFGAAIEASRSLGAGGYTSTSTGTAAKMFNQPFMGTMDHAWVMTHVKELGTLTLADLQDLEQAGAKKELQRALSKDAFRSFVTAFPEGGILLVDTYDPIQGLENAITVFKEMRDLGMKSNYGVRFDSGDVVKYSKIALRRFAEEGFIDGLEGKLAATMTDAQLLKLSSKCAHFCAAADGIDEYTAKEMRGDGAFFRAWGVGTAGSHVPPLGLVYKAADVYMDVLEDGEVADLAKMTPVMKVAAHAPVKSSNPGNINSRRFYDEDGKLAYVKIYDEDLGLDAAGECVNLRNFNDKKISADIGFSKDLLVPVFDATGKKVYAQPAQVESFPGSGHMVTDLAALSRTIRAELDTLPEGVRVVQRPRDEVLKKELLKAFTQAKKAGDSAVTIDIAAIEALLPREMPHVPVYLDMNLFKQRQACEKKHMAQANSSGVSEYHERFENAVEGADTSKKVKKTRGFKK